MYILQGLQNFRNTQVELGSKSLGNTVSDLH